MASAVYSTDSMSSTDMFGLRQAHTLDNDHATVPTSGSNPIGLFMTSFLDRCLNEDAETTSENTWGEGNGRAFVDIQNLVRPLSEQEELHNEERRQEAMQNTSAMSREGQQELIEALCRDEERAARFLAAGALLMRGSSNSMPLPMLSGHASANPVFLQALQALVGLLTDEQFAAAMAETEAAVEMSLVPAIRYVRRCSRRTVLKESQTEACPICLDKLLKTQRAQTLPCFHRLHSSCCNRYFKTPGVKPMCPICRFDMADAA